MSHRETLIIGMINGAILLAAAMTFHSIFRGVATARAYWRPVPSVCVCGVSP